MAPFWEWHAPGEAEHKAVAFDVMQLVGIGWLHRAWAVAIDTLGLLPETLDRTA
jgi:predicted metal-dependent hydrolase